MDLKFYRDSILTHIMKCFTNDTTKYRIIAHINPIDQFTEESICTLRFANSLYKQKIEKFKMPITIPNTHRVMKKNSSTSVLESATKMKIPFFTNFKKFIDMNKAYLKDLEDKISMMNYTYNNQIHPQRLKRAAIEFNSHVSELLNRNTVFLKKYHIATSNSSTSRKVHSRSLSH